MPASASPFATYSESEKKKARHWSLAAVVILTFALRGPQSVSWATAGVMAVGLGFGLNILSRWLKNWLNESMLMSGYATLAVLLFIVLFSRVFFGDSGLYQDLETVFGSAITPIAVAFIPTCLIWLGKARFWDCNNVGSSEIVYSGLITGLAAVIVAIISFLGDFPLHA